MSYITLFLMGDLSAAHHKVTITFTLHYHKNENPLQGCSHFRKEFHPLTRKADAKKLCSIKYEASSPLTHTNILGLIHMSK
jgi:hypothetical protein